MYKCKYCGKEFEKKQQLGGHIIWCKENPNRTGKSNLKFNQRKNCIIQYDLFCKYCGKQCKNKNSLVQHEIRCKENKHRISTKGNRVPHRAWNKGLTKETDERVKHQSESISNSYKTSKITNWCQGLNKGNDNRVKVLAEKSSKTILCKVRDGSWHHSFRKSKSAEYKGVKFHSNWEVEFAKFLDNNNIIWKRPTEKFEYIFLDKKIHYYTPDFYLPAFDLYIEIKGYPTDKDFLKWEHFPKDKTLDIYFGDDLSSLGIIDKYSDVYNNVDVKFREKHIKFFEDN
jgi:hypothetical protein